MGMLDKIKGLVGGNADKVKEGLDKAGDMIDDKTGGKYEDQIDTAAEKIGDMIDDVDADAEADTESE